KERIVKAMERLGQSITDCLNTSEEVRQILKELEGIGLQIGLSFVAMIRGGRPLSFPVNFAAQSDKKSSKLTFEITDKDKKYLESLGIKYDDEEPKKEE
ncbi:MAG: hypothetical protein ABIH42_00915, partial [Planctomycetota bacterium]